MGCSAVLPKYKYKNKSFQGVNPAIRQSVGLSFQIADRISEILEEKGMKQKDLAMLLGKKESEICKWMRGTHNFTIDTLVSIEQALHSSILHVVHKGEFVEA